MSRNANCIQPTVSRALLYVVAYVIYTTQLGWTISWVELSWVGSLKTSTPSSQLPLYAIRNISYWLRSCTTWQPPLLTYCRWRYRASWIFIEIVYILYDGLRYCVTRNMCFIFHVVIVLYWKLCTISPSNWCKTPWTMHKFTTEAN